MELLHTAFDIFIHLDAHLNQWAALLGPWLYAVLFLIIFCETGLVVAPYLPGDSLLFAVGALAARDGSPINLWWTWLLLSLAAILGDAVNYAAGKWIGPKIFARQDSWFLNRKHLDEAHRFYEKYGGKTIILARFVPIVRTFAPFVAGIGTMTYARFALYNVTGGLAWTTAFLVAGYKFSALPVVKTHFHLVILAIIFISCIPPVVEFLKARRAGRAEAEIRKA
ncbi:MAG TPA: DedA family protein [Elusimicrobia bacterium]|nr:DedA family protein [Elusimicrobiota bacterium]HBT61368.1 DedA family protein [Elusimicrobiota bacterium]